MCNIIIPKQPKVTRDEARKLVKESIKEAKKLHNSLRDGSWKASYNVDIVSYSK
ncbi:MAG: hypothetical protein PF693_02265 [Spirochaetia bacterium]|jgi:hypothetical protein|nr:hypothetical protein [Spirochaetia bacterium]